jgi:hypothetical protein
MRKNSIVVGLIVGLTVLALGWQTARTHAWRTNRLTTGPVQSPCESWRSTVSKLSDREKSILAKHGAVYNGNLTLSEGMVADCNLRGQMSSYFGKVIRGETDDLTREFAAQKSREVVGVLRRIWPSTSNSKALVADGSFDAEKYNLLSDPALQPAVVASLIAEIIAREQLGSNLAHVLLSRPMPRLRQSLLVRLAKAHRVGDIPQQIYCLAILHRLGDQSVLAKFTRLSRSRHLSKYEGKLIASLCTKIRSGERLTFADVEDLEYMNDR